MSLYAPHKRVPGARWQAPAETLSRAEGTITSSVRGSHVHISVKLRRTWAALVHDESLHGDNRQAYLDLVRLWGWIDRGTKIALCLAVLYLGYEIGSSFMPGGAAYRVITGGK